MCFQPFSRIKRIIAFAMPAVEMLAENRSAPYSGWTPGETQYCTALPLVNGAIARHSAAYSEPMIACGLLGPPRMFCAICKAVCGVLASST